MTPRNQTKTLKPKEVHEFISVRVDSFEACSSAGINYRSDQPHHALGPTDEEPIYQFETHLQVSGTILDPKDRSGNAFDLRIYGADSPTSRVFARLKDIRLLDEHNAPQYRTYRGRRYPVYR